MKRILLILCIAAAAISCKKHKYLSESGGDNSLNSANSTINARLKNSLPAAMLNVTIQDVTFGDVPAGESTAFRSIATSVDNAICSFSINGQPVSANSGAHACGSSVSSTSGSFTFAVSETSPGHYALSVTKN